MKRPAFLRRISDSFIKHKTVIFAVSALVVLTATVTVSAFRVAQQHKQLERLEQKIDAMLFLPFDDENAQNVFANDKKVLFVAAEYNGKAAIFSPDRSKLISIINVDFDKLPAADRALLSEGIEIYSQYQLLSLITDYTS